MKHNKTSLENGQFEDLPYKLAQKLIFKKVQQNLGLDQIKCIGVGAAPLSTDCLEYFLSLDIQLLECYGMSETCGTHTGNLPGFQCLGSIGPCITGCRMKVSIHY